MVPRFDLVAVKAALWISARFEEMQLKRLVLPEPERPMIPHFKGIGLKFRQKYMFYWWIQRFFLPLHPILSGVEWPHVLYFKSTEKKRKVKPGMRLCASN